MLLVIPAASNGVYLSTIKKELNYLKKLKNEIRKAKEIVIIGGGFIGVEFADELSKGRDHHQ